MIQRIQTVYLFIVVVLIGIFFFIPFSRYMVGPDISIYKLSIMGLKPESAGINVLIFTYPVFTLVAIAVLVSSVTVFLYKRRMLQIRLCVVNTILLLGLQGLLYYYSSVTSNQLGATTSYSIIFIFPLVSAILTYLALRSIAKDEALIRSLNRLR